MNQKRDSLENRTRRDPFEIVSVAVCAIAVTILSPYHLGAQEVCTYWDYKGVFEVTRYCACKKCCGRYADGRTHLGTPVRYGVVAVDPTILPLAREVKVGGFPKTFRAEDTGTAIHGHRIDVFHNNHHYCLKWGRQRRRVWLRKRGPGLSEALDGGMDVFHRVGEMAVELAGLPFSLFARTAGMG